MDAITEGPPRPKPDVVADVRAGAMVDTVPGASIVDRDKCIGCGVCVIACPDDAIVMEPVSEEEWFHVPNSLAEWEERRLEYLAGQKQPRPGHARGAS